MAPPTTCAAVDCWQSYDLTAVTYTAVGPVYLCPAHEDERELTVVLLGKVVTLERISPWPST